MDNSLQKNALTASYCRCVDPASQEMSRKARQGASLALLLRPQTNEPKIYHYLS
jgi:hypothetical protein